MDIFAKAAIALLLERITGYPDILHRLAGHPVQWMGAFISMLEDRLNTSPHDRFAGLWRGALAVAVLVFATTVMAWLLAWLLNQLPLGSLLEALTATVFLAQKSLRDHVRDVVRGLSSSLLEARQSVAKIVGRNTENLDENGISRAALESLAESTADGIVAPVFWYLLLGLPGLAVYKVVNTADSMIGHRVEPYTHFGFAAARLDDLLNFIPARLTALLFAGAALFNSKDGARSVLNIAWRDAGNHRSPNAGWPEAAMAGALGLRFGGPRSYGGEKVDLPWLGDGREHLTRTDIANGLSLYDTSLWMLFAIIAALAIAL
jgi:adenosylcobinamide-phosphate synthase